MDYDVEDTENMDNTHHEEEALEKDDWVEQQRRGNKKKKSQSINPDVGSPKPDITSTSRSQLSNRKDSLPYQEMTTKSSYAQGEHSNCLT
ncbi:hypothetical protein HPB48_003337 [Haemaphysalis longicornis]|uniref:Uncharacterized protein n=1 Tax=Haemaphysalis longicornis TaxID=44386 RepID=A0A9J6GW85_HAELO|nr:hypothetical protein HPB48_003337 [Haemaphysalis longicornis]